MKSIISLPAGLVATVLLICAPTTTAHTWIEEMRLIASNGTFVGPLGYPRGYVSRAPGADANLGNVYQLPPNGRSTGNAILATDLMCKGTQTVGTQTAGFPQLVASPGDHIAMRYLENGHVTQPNNPLGKPKGSGTVYVYGTSKSANTDTYLGIHHVWNVEGTGGDSRGVLLATRPFDDGQCYEFNPSEISTSRQAKFAHKEEAPMGKSLWCQTDIQLPAKVTDNYTLYWVWEWPTLDSSGKVVTNESYTSCMDIQVKPASGASSKAKTGSFVKGQDLNSAAVQAQLENPFLVKPKFTDAPAGSVPAPAPAPSQPPPAAVSPAPGNNVSSPPPAPTGFITMTVTATPAVETVYVTVSPTTSKRITTLTVSPFPPSKTTITRTAGAALSTSTPAAPPASSVPKSTPTAAPSVQPAISPFLSPESSPIPGSSRTSFPPAPIPTTATFANGTKLASRYRIRGRSVRL